MKRWFSCVSGIGVLLFCIPGTAGKEKSIRPQENAQIQTFKVKTELVEIRTVVTDREGQIIENLTKADFELSEDGHAQDIIHFSVSKADGSLEKSSQDASSRSSGLRDRLGSPPSRSTILYVDNLNLTYRNLTWVKQNLRRFVDERMTDQDAVAIVASDGSLGIAQQFTRDRQILRYAIDQIRMGPIIWETGGFTATLAGRIMRGDTQALEEGKALVLAEENIEDKYGSWTRARAERVLFGTSYFRETMLSTLKALIEQLSAMPGQRMLTIFSEGFTQNGRDGFPKFNEVRSAINRAARSGVVIYSIDGRGLSFEQPDPEKQDGLAALAKETGGEFYMNDNNITASISKAFEANKFYYVLGYYLKSEASVNRFRSIKVRLRKHPEYVARTIRGFSLSEIEKGAIPEADATPQQRLYRSIHRPLPVTDIGVSAQLDFVKAAIEGPQVLLTVRFDGNKLNYQEKGPDHAFAVEILYMIYDSAGKQVEALTTNVQGSLTSERLAQGQTHGFVFSKQLILKPGIYQARIGVQEPDTGRIGTTTAWVDVPDLDRSKIALSSLVLLDPLPAGNEAQADMESGELKQIRMVQGIRLFSRNRYCGYVFRIFQNGNNPSSSELTMKMELLKSNKPVKQNQWVPLAARQKDGEGNGEIYVGGKVNLAGLSPGIYELSISVRDGGSKKAAQRTAVFGVD
jgi:VWFA-related protein